MLFVRIQDLFFIIKIQEYYNKMIQKYCQIKMYSNVSKKIKIYRNIAVATQLYIYIYILECYLLIWDKLRLL